jgi:guanylate kinase
MVDDASTISDRIAKKLAGYSPSAETRQLVRDSSIMLIVGVSGAGKDTLITGLSATGDFQPLVSHTTRKPRVNHGVSEVDGVDYHFIDLAEAERLIDERAVVEVKMYSGNVYGSSAQELTKIKDARKIATSDIEVQGVAEYRELSPAVGAIFLLPPNYGVWQKRLTSRYAGAIDTEDFRKRMETAIRELEFALQADYFHYIINDDMVETVASVLEVVQLGGTSEFEEARGREVAERLLEEAKKALEHKI